jgi:hypothetical protein
MVLLLLHHCNERNGFDLNGRRAASTGTGFHSLRAAVDDIVL